MSSLITIREDIIPLDTQTNYGRVAMVYMTGEPPFNERYYMCVDEKGCVSNMPEMAIQVKEKYDEQ